MEKKNSQNLKSFRVLFIVIILIGLGLMIFMITVEDEPGALPLLLIVLGTISLIINQIKIKKQNA
ncbi:hypothetical protein [Marivirga sp.]|uniref:hypothetical protein n=1 Tax=Marivirga sp. TaxID=2018662 RepID=UPI002D7FB6F6|nr:hypothetical protein [Marivirga sp.]HET8860879.1 hypothetical protein [Marivirga sp.]